MSGFWQDLRYGARIVLRSPGFAAVVVAIVALGIGANSAIFSVVNAVLLRPLPYRDPGRLYELAEVSPRHDANGASAADLAAFEQHTQLFEKTAISHWQNITLTGPEGPENVYGGMVSKNCFPLLGAAPALGRPFRDNEFRPGAPGVVLLSDRLWRRRFGRNPGVIGRPMMMNGQAFAIVGVMPPDFFFTQRYELWTPWQWTADVAGNREPRYPAVVRLNPGVTAERARAELEAVYRSVMPEDARKGWRIRLTPLSTQVTSPVRSALLVLLGAVGFVLLIACLNVANLLLARAAGRSREIAVRVALGAGRLRVVRQLLTESLLLAGLGGAAGLLLSHWGARALVALSPGRIPVPRLEQTRMDASVLLFTFALALATGLAFGLIPAWQASRTSLEGALKEGGRTSTGGARSHRLRNILVVAETALSLILLIGAGLLIRSFDRLLRVNAGFNPERVLTLRIPLPTGITGKPQQVGYYERMLDRIQGLPGLNAAGLIAPLPLGEVDANATFVAEGHPVPPGERQFVKLRAVSPGYFRVMGIPLRRGRVFHQADGPAAPAVVVVNDALVRRYFPNEDPLGKRVSLSGKADAWLTIVGVVNDVKFLTLTGDPAPEMYRDFRQFFFAPFATTFTLRTAADDPMQLAAAAQREIRAINPDQPISDLRTMRQVMSDNVATPRFYMLLLGGLAAMALLLAAIGVYGVLSYSVSQRVHEIGIRVALGAPRHVIFRQVVGQALVLAGVGVAAGLAGSFALTRLIASQLYGVTATDPLTFASVSLLLVAVAATASYLPARRAMAVDPMTALRFE